MKKRVFATIILLLVAAGMAFGQGTASSPLTGVVVMSVGEEFLVDIDAASGLAVGDVLEVVQDGAEIVHPTSGEVLGRLEKVIAKLRVTRLATGYSYATPLGEAGAIARGDRVQRPAVGVNVEQTVATPPSVAPPAAPVAPEVRFGASLPGVMVGVEVADVDGDGKLETIALFAHRLEVARLNGDDLKSIATVELGLAQRAIAIDAIDLDGDGRVELYITAVDGGELRSLAVALADSGEYRIKHKNIPWYLRAVTLPGEGRVLLGQKMGWDGEIFRDAPFRVAFAAGRPVEGTPLTGPPGMSLYGFTPFLDAAGKTLFAQLTSYDLLRVSNGQGEILWESIEAFGGSEISFDLIDPQRNDSRRPNELLVFVQPRLEIGPAGELLLPMHDGSRLFKRSQTFDQGRLVAMRWNGHGMVEQWRSPDQKAYLADYRLTDVDGDGRRELVVAQVFLREGFMNKGRSALTMIEAR